MGSGSNRLIEVYLEERGSKCPKCAFDLRDLKFGDHRPRCPECGTFFRLETRLVRWIGDPRERSQSLRRIERMILWTILCFVIGLVGMFFLGFLLYSP